MEKINIKHPSKKDLEKLSKMIKKAQERENKEPWYKWRYE